MSNNRIYSLIPPNLSGLILCFDHWENPEDFFTMSKKERLDLYKKYRPHGKLPTEQNHWIWFGTYAKLQPRYHNVPVARLLYTTFIQPDLPEGKRVNAIGTDTPADVNPFKYSHGVGATIKQQMQNVVELEAVLKEIDELYFPDALDTKDMMRQALTHNGHDSALIELALTKTDKELK